MTRKLATLFLFFAALIPASAQTGVNATSIKITASSAITSVYINGTAQTLGTNSANWKIDDNYGPNTNLQVLAVTCTNATPNTTDAGFIGTITLSDGRHILTDDCWKCYHSGTSAPPADAGGHQWYELNYDDSGWANATIDGCYGIPPWGTNASAPTGLPSGPHDGAAPQLDADMRSIVSSAQFGAIPAWMANWIWSGNAAFGVSPVYFRRTFASTASNTLVKPTSPDKFALSSITSTGATLSWSPCFAPSGIAQYNIYWNGLALTSSSGTSSSCTVTGLNISAHPQNYFYVTAVDNNGNESTPTPFLVAQTTPSGNPTSPANIHITTRYNNGFTVAWDPGSSSAGIASYGLTIGGNAFEIVPGSTTASCRNSSVLHSGSSYAVSFQTVDLAGKQSSVNIGNWMTLPSSPTTLNPPTALAITGSTSTSVTLGWTASTSSGITGYRIFKNGLPISTTATTSGTITGLVATSSYYFQVSAYDALGNESVTTSPLPAMAGGSIAPTTPQIFDGGRTDSTIGLRWVRPTNPGAVTSYTVKQWAGAAPSGTSTDTLIGDPYATYYSASSLSGTYTYEVVANGLGVLSTTSAPVTLNTVVMPTGTPSLKFAFGYKSNNTNSTATGFMSDAIAQGCTLISFGGNMVTENDAGLSPAQAQTNWSTLVTAITGVVGTVPVLPAPDAHDTEYAVSEIYLSTTPVVYTRYDYYMNAMGPIQYVKDLAGVRFISAPDLTSLGPPAYYSPVQRACQLYLQQQLQTADADPTVKAIVNIGACNDNLPGHPLSYNNSFAWQYPVYQTSKPIINLGATVNGTPPFQMTWGPGQNFLSTASGVLYTQTSYSIVSVFSDRIMIQNRAKSGSSYVNSGLYEILYSRSTNTLNPTQVSITDVSNFTGKQIPPPTNLPPWAQNVITPATENQPQSFQLLGRSVSGASLTYTIVQSPAHGTVSGTGASLTYTPASNYIGGDYLLYKVNDGLDSNYAWISFNVAAGTGLPAPWQQTDIGTVASGTATCTSGTFSLSGGGTQISGTSDSFHFVYQTVTGDCTITAREVTETGYHHSIDGVIIRDSLAANAAFADTFMRQSTAGAYYGSRASDGGTGSYTFSTACSPPEWLRVQRSGNTFTESISSNGTTWTTISSGTVTMGSTVYVGLTQCSGDNSVGGSSYDNVSVTTP